MIFDIASSIGTTRRYYLLNGKEIDGFDLPAVSLPSGNNLAFVESESDDSILLQPSPFNTGTRNHVASYYNIQFPNIQDYNELGLVVSFGGGITNIKVIVQTASVSFVNTMGWIRLLDTTVYDPSPNIIGNINFADVIISRPEFSGRLPEDLVFEIRIEASVSDGYVNLHHIYAE